MIGRERDYQTTPLRSVVALAGGAVVGALLVSAYVMTTEFGQPVPTLSAGIEGGLWIFGYALVAWVGGLAIIAPLPWLILHRLKLRTWWVAAILGAVLASVVAFLGASIILVDMPDVVQGHVELRGLLGPLVVGGIFGSSGRLSVLLCGAVHIPLADRVRAMPIADTATGTLL